MATSTLELSSPSLSIDPTLELSDFGVEVVSLVSVFEVDVVVSSELKFLSVLDLRESEVGVTTFLGRTKAGFVAAGGGGTAEGLASSGSCE